jgi:uncharacterized protein YjiS (DUF1127 family)
MQYFFAAMQHASVISLVYQFISAPGRGQFDSGRLGMTTLAVRLPSGRGARRSTWLATLLGAFEEGLRKAERYQSLARKSDAELADLGLRREDLPRIVMFGKS